MKRHCLDCEREFTAEYATDVFCGTFCQNTWWSYPGAADLWKDLVFFACLAWEESEKK